MTDTTTGAVDTAPTGAELDEESVVFCHQLTAAYAAAVLTRKEQGN